MIEINDTWLLWVVTSTNSPLKDCICIGKGLHIVCKFQERILGDHAVIIPWVMNKTKAC